MLVCDQLRELQSRNDTRDAGSRKSGGAVGAVGRGFTGARHDVLDVMAVGLGEEDPAAGPDHRVLADAPGGA